MLKRMCLYAMLVLLTLSAQRCLVQTSGGAPGDQRYTVYVTHSEASTTPSSLASHHQIGAHNSHAYHHAIAAGSGAHLDNRNSYNLLSEAMSQAVSNEFSSLGSGSADGACHADDLECYSGNVQDRLGMEAIRTLHRQLDDDDNGNIDLSESDDFLREELKYDSGYEKRQKAFHFNDDMHISVKELWEAWLRSEVHNWTIEQTTDWLAQSVQLPQYVELFKLHKVTGAALPRLAVNNMHYVSNVLGIKDPIHKQKISLKAMDVVLFGPPRETGTRWKDYILVTLLLSAIIGCWYAYQQNKNAKRHLRRMAQDMEGLQRAEQSLQEMQKELERARMEQENVATEKMDLERRLKEAPSLTSSSSDLEVQQLKKEIEILRSELSRAEIELVDNCWAPPPQLQSWLQYTYELESKNHQKKRISAEKQLLSAREACEKLRKKRSSLVGAFVSTHGKSIDDVDRSIVEARNSLSEVTNELQERLNRWKHIENCLGFNIVNNNGLAHLESVLYGRNGGTLKNSRGRMTSSTDDLDDESVQGMFDYNRSSVSVSGGHGGNNSGLINNNSNTMRDDSSCSDDGVADTQSVQFYLGNTPSTPISAATMSSGVPRSMPSTSMVNSINHIGGTSNALSTSITGTGGGSGTNVVGNSLSNIVSPLPLPTSSSSSASPPPLPPHSNAHTTNFTFNDSVIVIDDNRSSPSVSSERSIPIPPRSKKSTVPTAVPQTPPPPPPPPASGPIGRAPLPPPRKANHSQLLRSQSTDLVPMEIYTYLGARTYAPSKPGGIISTAGTIGTSKTCNTSLGHGYVNNNGNVNSRNNIISGPKTGAGGIGGNNLKKMVKQHSTASQQSTSSTSSSVHSAPAGSAPIGGLSTTERDRDLGTGSGKDQQPGRWSSHERIMPVYEHQQLIQHHQYQYQPLRQYTLDEKSLQQSYYTPTTTSISATTSIASTAKLSTVSSSAGAPCMSDSISLQSLCFKPQCDHVSGDTNATTVTTTAPTIAAAYSDTQLENEQLFTTEKTTTKEGGTGTGAGAGARDASDVASLDSASLDGNFKKRKRRLRFPFGGSGGSKKSLSNKSKLI